MAGPLLNIDVMGDVQLSRGFSRFAEDVKDLSEPFREIVRQFKGIEQKQFNTEGGYGSGGWKPLAPSTVEHKEREGFSAKILVRTGLLMESLTGESPWTIAEVRPLELRLGTKLEYALLHQKGTSRMPARPVIDLTEKDKMDFMKTIQRYLVKNMKKEFGGLMGTAGAGAAHLGGI